MKNVEEFQNNLDSLNKSEQEIFEDFIYESVNDGFSDMTPYSAGVEARAKDLKLDQIVEITQELPDGRVKRFKFKIIEVWPTPPNFFTVSSIKKPMDSFNFWTLFYNNTWYIKKANKSLVNVHVKLI